MPINEPPAYAYLLFKILNLVSLITSLFTFITYFVWVKKFPARLNMYYCIVTMFQAIILLASAFSHDLILRTHVFCQVQGTLLEFVTTCLVCWWFCITLNIYFTIAHGKETSKYQRYMHIVSWGVPLLDTVLNFAFTDTTDMGLWCLTAFPGNKVWMYVTFFLGVVLSVVGFSLWLVIIWKAIGIFQSINTRTRNSTNHPSQLFRSILFLFLQMILFAYSIAHEQYIYEKGDSGPAALTIIHLTLMGSQGLLTFLIFGARKQNYRYWRDLILSMCQKLRNHYEYEYHSVENV